MSRFKFQIIKDENELRNRINDLDKIANSYIMMIQNLYIEDLFFIAIIDKSIKLIDSFLFALANKNITVLATLTRIQMDCALRAFAVTIAKNSNEFCHNVLTYRKPINTLTDTNNNKLSDKYLCKKLESYIKLPVYDLYKKVCGFVHFSSESFYNIANVQEPNELNIFVSRQNRDDNKKEFERLSLELANQFFFFGSILIEDIFASWLEHEQDN